MRRPVLCGTRQSDGVSEAPSQCGEGALSRVRRLLSGTLPGRDTSRPECRTFGTSLDVLAQREDACDGVPFAVVRLCSYIETHGLGHEGVFRTAADQKLVEKLRSCFDRSGDADLEAIANIHAAASLLKLFLWELPDPAVSEAACTDMLQATSGISSRGEQGHGPEIRKAISSMAEENRRLLRYISFFLRRVARHETQNRMSAAALGVIFGPSLFRQRSLSEQSACNHLVTAFITDFHVIFPETKEYKAATTSTTSTHSVACHQEEAVTGSEVSAPANQQQSQRKRKERHESTGSSQIAHDRKVIRSNSQERTSDGTQEVVEASPVPPQKPNSNDANLGTQHLPLHEHNSPMEEEEEIEHERRRSSERFASFPRNCAPRSGGIGRRYHQPRRARRESKENSVGRDVGPQGQLSVETNEPCIATETNQHAFLQLHPSQQGEQAGERERSPSPATPRAAPPMLDLSTLHQQVDCSEPLPSQAPHHRIPEDSQVLLSPRNSMILTRRLDPNMAPSPPVDHVSASRRREEGGDGRAKQISRNISSLKKKIKIYEEQFEIQNGFRPSHADKMVNKDLKKMFSELNRLRKEMKQLKVDAATSATPLVQSLVLEDDDDSSPDAPKEIKGDENGTPTLSSTIEEVQRRLQEKRDEAGRPMSLEELTREQQLEEKLVLQKALLHLESLHGRPVSRADRDLVRPLYDRYRSLKRLVIRSGGSKLRDSMSELATILEHQAMDFTATASESAAESADAAGTAELPERSAAETVEEPEPPLFSENLHALPLSELLSRQLEAREEKKRLRRSLREFEEEFQRDTGRKLQREDREPRLHEYASYKQTKAKLRLLEALLAKHGQAPRSC